MHFNNEKEVEFFYWNILKVIGKSIDKASTLTADNKTDGLLKAGGVEVLFEIKYGLDFTNNQAHIARVLIQALYYLKRMQKQGLKLPSSLFIGDDNEYFIMATKQFTEFLEDSFVNEEDPDWKIAPSSAYTKNHKLFEKLFLKEWPRMMRYIDNNFDVDFVKTRFIALAQNEDIKTKLTSETIKKPFFYFTTKVLTTGSDLKDHAKIKLFLNTITGNDDVIYKKGKLRFEKVDYPINDDMYAGFTNVYQAKYKASEREKFVANMDSLLGDEARRFHGAFFTPKLFVDYAHKMMDEELGKTWREDYVVWDPACGTKNLTADYRFSELYMSTLFQEELDLSEDLNSEGTAFQFDFLNDEIKAIRDGGKVPDGLYDALQDEEKKVMILMNPPYAAAGSGFGNNFKKNTNKILQPSLTLKADMKIDGIGRAAQDLYVKFIYKIVKEEIGTLAMFTPTTFIRSRSANGMKTFITSKLSVINNFVFDSKYFEGASGGWPIMFSIWNDTKNDNTMINGNFVEIKDSKVVEVGTKKFYIPEDNITKWIDSSNQGLDKTKDSNLCLSMPCTIKPLRTHKKPTIDFLGDMGIKSLVEGVTGDKGIYTAPYSNHKAHKTVTRENYERSIVYETVRTIVEKTLLNGKDDFQQPNILHDKYKQFSNDCLLFVLFENQAFQSSLRSVGYDSTGEPIDYPTTTRKGTIDVKNEWFFMRSNGLLIDLADENFPAMYRDAKGSKDSFVYTKIKEIYDTRGEKILEIARNEGQEVKDAQELYKMLSGTDNTIEIDSNAKELIEKYEKENFFSKEALDVLSEARNVIMAMMQPIGDGGSCLRKTLHESNPELHLNAWDAGWWQIRTALKRNNLDGAYLTEFNKKLKELQDKLRPMVYKLGFLPQFLSLEMATTKPYDLDKIIELINSIDGIEVSKDHMIEKVSEPYEGTIEVEIPVRVSGVGRYPATLTDIELDFRITETKDFDLADVEAKLREEIFQISKIEINH